MIVETVVSETTLSPHEIPFQPLDGGLRGQVTVRVIDARGAARTPDWDETRSPDGEVLWAVNVHLRETWAYPVKILVDQAKTVDEREVAELRWHYGPTDWNPDEGRMWHYDCPAGAGEVMYDKDGGAYCEGCGAWQAPDDESPDADEEQDA